MMLWPWFFDEWDNMIAGGGEFRAAISLVWLAEQRRAAKAVVL